MSDISDKLTTYKNELNENINKFEDTIKAHCEGINEINKRVEINKISIEVMNTNIYKFNDDFKDCTKRFESITIQHKIFHKNIKESKNKIDIITKDRISFNDFKERTNEIIVNLQKRIEDIEEFNKNTRNDTSVIPVKSNIPVKSDINHKKLENKLKDYINIKFRELNNTIDKKFDKYIKREECDRYTIQINELTDKCNYLSSEITKLNESLKKNNYKKDLDVYKNHILQDFKKEYDLKYKKDLDVYKNQMLRDFKKEYDLKYNEFNTKILKQQKELINKSVKINVTENIDKMMDEITKRISNTHNETVSIEKNDEQLLIRLSTAEQMLIYHANILTGQYNMTY